MKFKTHTIGYLLSILLYFIAGIFLYSHFSIIEKQFQEENFHKSSKQVDGSNTSGSDTTIAERTGNLSIKSNSHVLYKPLKQIYSSFDILTNKNKLPYTLYTLEYKNNAHFFYYQLYNKILTLVISIIILVLTLSIFRNTEFVSLKCSFVNLYIKRMKHIQDRTEILVPKKQDNSSKHAKESGEYIKQIKNLVETLNSIEISSNHQSKFQSLIHGRFIEAVDSIKDTIEVLINSIEGKSKLSITYEQQLYLLNSAYNKLIYLSSNCIAKEKHELIDISTIINDALNTFAKESLANDLSFVTSTELENTELYHDEVFVRQIIISILSEFILPAKSKCTITIHSKIKRNNNKEYLNLSIKDNGFGISNSNYKKNLNKLPLILDIDVISKFITCIGGTLETNYEVGKWTKVTLILPLQNKQAKIIEIVNFKTRH